MQERLYVPTKIELVYLFFCSVLTLFLLSVVPILKKSDPATYHYMSDTIGEYISKVLVKLHGHAWSTTITVLLWVILGIFVYIVLWSCASLYNAYKSDVLPSKVLVPKGYKRSSNNFDLLARIAIRTIALVLFLAWMILFLGATLPRFTALFTESLSSFKWHSLLDIFGSIIVVMVGYFVAMVLVRLIYLRKRIFS